METEKIWVVEPFTIEEDDGFHQFTDLVWKGSRDGRQPGAGTLFAMTASTGLKGSEAHALGDSVLPLPEQYAGARLPELVYRVEDGSRIVIDRDNVWDWSEGPFMPMFSHSGTIEHRRAMKQLHDLSSRPDWWPTIGAVAEARSEAGQFVPDRNAVIYVFNAKVPRVKGEHPVASGPYEYIVEDHSTGRVRLVGFKLEGERGPRPSPLMMAFDGSWAITFDKLTMRAWFLPLHLAWDYLDGEQAVEEESKGSEEAPSESGL